MLTPSPLLKIYLKHYLDGKCGLFFSVHFPLTDCYAAKNCRRGVGMRIWFKVGDSPGEWIEQYFLDGEGQGSTTCLNQEAWQEAVMEDKLQFSIGRLEAKASFVTE